MLVLCGPVRVPCVKWYDPIINHLFNRLGSARLNMEVFLSSLFNYFINPLCISCCYMRCLFEGLNVDKIINKMPEARH